MKLIVGLGNPGSEYAATRHNVGFMVIDQLARTMRITDLGKRWHGVAARALYAGEKVYILKPHTYMNNSGKAVAAAIRELNPQEEDIIIAYDELALPLGTLRFRPSGSDGGQKGMRSILQTLGHQRIPRLRLGIGAAADSPLTPRDYVLSSFSKEEQPLLEAMLDQGAQALALWLHRGIGPAMNKYNGAVELKQ